jgi:hypothetical protein
LQIDLAAIKSPTPDATSAPIIDKNRAQAILRTMRLQLSNADFAATQTLTTHGAYFQQLFGAKYQVFHNHLSHFEFESALDQLNAASQTGNSQ